MKKSHNLLGWMFNVLYWFDATRIPKKKWKEELYKKYVLSGRSKGFKKGSFRKAWKFMRKEHLIREGKRGSCRKFKQKKKENKDE